jgi:hypothetical protein
MKRFAFLFVIRCQLAPHKAINQTAHHSFSFGNGSVKLLYSHDTRVQTNEKVNLVKLSQNNIETMRKSRAFAISFLLSSYTLYSYHHDHRLPQYVNLTALIDLFLLLLSFGTVRYDSAYVYVTLVLKVPRAAATETSSRPAGLANANQQVEMNE